MEQLKKILQAIGLKNWDIKQVPTEEEVQHLYEKWEELNSNDELLRG